MSGYSVTDLVRVAEMKVGKIYLVSSVNAETPLHENGSIYPWGDKRAKIPVYCAAEHKHFYTCKVLPHTTEGFRFGNSKPYTVSIMKRDLLLGETRVYEAEKECYEI